MPDWMLYVAGFVIYLIGIWVSRTPRPVVNAVPEEALGDIAETHYLVKELFSSPEAPEQEVLDRFDAMDKGFDAVLDKLTELDSDIAELKKPTPVRATRKRTTKRTTKRAARKKAVKK